MLGYYSLLVAISRETIVVTSFQAFNNKKKIKGQHWGHTSISLNLEQELEVTLGDKREAIGYDSMVKTYYQPN